MIAVVLHEIVGAGRDGRQVRRVVVSGPFVCREPRDMYVSAHELLPEQWDTWVKAEDIGAVIDIPGLSQQLAVTETVDEIANLVDARVSR